MASVPRLEPAADPAVAPTANPVAPQVAIDGVAVPAEAVAYEPRIVSYPGSPFRLNQPYPPAGDQPEAIAKLIEGMNDGLAFQTLLGVTGSGKTFTMANVIAQLGRPAMVLAPNKTLAAQLYSEMREFFPENAVEYFVSYYDYYQPEAYVPSRDLFIEKDSSINEHIEQMRLSATKSLMERRDCVIVATVSAIYGIGDPSEYHSMILHVKEGDALTQRDAIKRLTEMQYQRNEADFRRGTFRVRGDVIDVFPAEHAENAVRIAMFDDTIESLQLFDPLTGHIRHRIGRFTVFPSSHYVTGRQKVLARYRSYHGATGQVITATGDPRRWAAETGVWGIVRIPDFQPWGDAAHDVLERARHLPAACLPGRARVRRDRGAALPLRPGARIRTRGDRGRQSSVHVRSAAAQCLTT